MNDQFNKMQKLAFGKVLINENTQPKEEVNENMLKDKIKEIIKTSLNEKKKKKEDPEDVAPQSDENIDDLIDVEDETSIPADTIEPDNTAADINPQVKAIQDSLQKAFASAKQLGDEKLMQQIGNTITMVVRTQVLGQVSEDSLNEEENYKTSDEIYQKMNSLVSKSDYMNFIDSAIKIMEHLTEEGFEAKDIFYWLNTRLTAEV